VEVGLEQVQVVFRVDSFPGESDPEKKSLQLCRGSTLGFLRELLAAGRPQREVAELLRVSVNTGGREVKKQ
jgi:hypothetical protein